MIPRIRVRKGAARLRRTDLAPGDALAAQIEARLLAPLERAVPAAASLVRAVRKCGGCNQAKHALGSNEKHPDAAAPII